MTLTTTRSSTVRVFEACPRQWLLLHTRGERLSSAAMSWGTDMHECLEHWLRDGTPPPATPWGRAARKSLVHLPPPSHNLDVERKWTIPLAELGGGDYTGAIDLCDLNLCLDAQGVRYVRMWDHKSCADTKWAKTPAELQQDISACAYAYWLLQQVPEATEVRCRWVYTQRDARSSVPVDFVITRKQAAARWTKTLDSVRQMQALLAAQTDPLQVPGNTDHCEAYGGCMYLNTCYDPAPDVVDTFRPRATLPVIQEERRAMAKSALLEKLRAGLDSPPAPAPASKPTPPGDPINPPDAAPHHTPDLSAFSTTVLLQELLRRSNT